VGVLDSVYKCHINIEENSYSISLLQMISPFDDISFSVLQIIPGSIEGKGQKAQKGTFFLGLSLLTNIIFHFCLF
jgi:hypothetical protein